MNTLITNDIRISVEMEYRPEHSAPSRFKYVFSYEITIQNIGSRRVQLLRRHWYIMDGLGMLNEVEGPGVIGKQPVFNPNDLHQYQSWSEITTDVGKMYGYYTMIDLDTEKHFKVLIPEFLLVARFKHN